MGIPVFFRLRDMTVLSACTYRVRVCLRSSAYISSAGLVWIGIPLSTGNLHYQA